MRGGKIEVKMKTGQTIQVLPGEVVGLREAGLLPEEETQDKPAEEETREPEREGKTRYKLPVLTKKERRQRIRQAKKLVKAGYSIREVGRKLNVSHTCIIKWRKNNWKPLETSQKRHG